MSDKKPQLVSFHGTDYEVRESKYTNGRKALVLWGKVAAINRNTEAKDTSNESLTPFIFLHPGPPSPDYEDDEHHADDRQQHGGELGYLVEHDVHSPVWPVH